MVFLQAHWLFFKLLTSQNFLSFSPGSSPSSRIIKVWFLFCALFPGQFVHIYICLAFVMIVRLSTCPILNIIFVFRRIWHEGQVLLSVGQPESPYRLVRPERMRPAAKNDITIQEDEELRSKVRVGTCWIKNMDLDFVFAGQLWSPMRSSTRSSSQIPWRSISNARLRFADLVVLNIVNPRMHSQPESKL